MYTKEDVIHYIESEGVRFIRLAFFDLYGKQKNISIQPAEIYKAFEEGIVIDGSQIFDSEDFFDLYLVPDPKTMSTIPWRSFDGGVIRMYCDIYTAEHQLFEMDARGLLKKVIRQAKAADISVSVASKFEFYLFHKDEYGQPSGKPLDQAGYMDIAPEDKGEDVRRQICYYLSEMGMGPQSSHHEAGPGQNEIDFHASSPLKAADEAGAFKWIVRTVAESNGLYADFSPKPIQGEAGNAMIIRISAGDVMDAFTAGILAHLTEMTTFLNPAEESYERLGKLKSPRSAGYSLTDHKQAVRILTAAEGQCIELRSPDNMCNPYIAYALIMSAGMEGIAKGLKLPEKFINLPSSLEEAKELSRHSTFIKEVLPEAMIEAYCK